MWGISSAGYAGVFSGKALVTGPLSKGGGSFKIDHPLDPANKYLYHSFVESPDMMNVYNGNVSTNASGTVTVALPDYFMSLNRDFRYQLTVVGEFAQAIVSKEPRTASSRSAPTRRSCRPDAALTTVSSGCRSRRRSSPSRSCGPW